MENIINVVKSLEESGLLIKSVSQTIKNKVKEQKGEFFVMLLGTLAANVLGSASADKGVIKVDDGVIRADEGVISAGQNF